MATSHVKTGNIQSKYGEDSSLKCKYDAWHLDVQAAKSSGVSRIGAATMYDATAM